MSDPGDKTYTQIEVDALLEAAADKATAQAVTDERGRHSALMNAFAGDLAFANEQFAAGKTVEQGQAAYSFVLAGKVEEQSAELEKLREQATKAAGQAPAPGADGAPPLEQDGDAATGQLGFMETAEALAKEKDITKAKAMSQIAREQPELHKAFLAKA